MIRLVKTDRKPDFTGVTPAFIVGATLFFSGVIAVYMVSRNAPIPFVPCVFKMVTHHPCFLCGGTRATVFLTSGNFPAAVKINPLVTIALLVVGVVAILKFGFALRFQLTGILADRRFLWMIAIVIIGTNWIYVVRTL